MEMKKLLIKAEELNKKMVYIDEMFDDEVNSIEMEELYEELYNELSDEAYKEYYAVCEKIADMIVEMTYGNINKKTAMKMAFDKRSDLLRLFS